ncbi:MAG: hypothetical protein ACMUEM_07220 [Flavobacteriales bacterium AspAUS03]
MRTFLYIVLIGFILLLGTQLYLIFWEAVSEDQGSHLIGAMGGACGILLVTVYLLLQRIRARMLR